MREGSGRSVGIDAVQSVVPTGCSVHGPTTKPVTIGAGRVFGLVDARANRTPTWSKGVQGSTASDKIGGMWRKPERLIERSHA